LLAKAPDPASAARLTITAISAALTRARRRNVADKAARIQAVLRGQHLGLPEVITAAYAATTRAAVAVLRTLDEQVKALQGQVDAHFGQHPDAKIISSQPGLGPVLGARVLAEFGDDPHRYTDAKSRKNYAATSPITRASGKKKTVMARYVHNDRLIDALMAQAFSALNASPGAAPTTTNSKPAAPDTTPPCANSPTGSSASCTAALKPAPATTNQPHGRTGSSKPPLDIQAPGISTGTSKSCWPNEASRLTT
jgi:hypothetical protein